MNRFQKVLAAAICAAAVSAVQAVPMNLGGVIIDPDSPFDFSGSTATITQLINPVTGELSGFGNITSTNGSLQNTFCPGCELTIVYDSYLPRIVGAVPVVGGPAQQIEYLGGNVRLYVDNGSGASVSTANGTNLTLASASDGVLWLGMSGHPDASGDTLTGFNAFSTLNLLSGFGSLDIMPGLAGGLARNNLDTNSRANGADIAFTNSFTAFPNGTPLAAFGSGNFAGDTVAVPEPATLAVLGLGLAGIAGARRRKAAGA